MQKHLSALASLPFDDLCRLPERFAAYAEAGLSVSPYEDEAAFARELLRRKGFEIPETAPAPLSNAAE